MLPTTLPVKGSRRFLGPSGGGFLAQCRGLEGQRTLMTYSRLAASSWRTAASSCLNSESSFQSLLCSSASARLFCTSLSMTASSSVILSGMRGILRGSVEAEQSRFYFLGQPWSQRPHVEARGVTVPGASEGTGKECFQRYVAAL
jgi:hypothetical protein